MYQPPSDIAIITKTIVQLGAILLILGVFIWKITYAIHKNAWKCVDACNSFYAFFIMLLFAFVPGSLLLYYVYRKIRKLFKRRRNCFNEIEDKYKWYSEHA